MGFSGAKSGNSQKVKNNNTGWRTHSTAQHSLFVLDLFVNDNLVIYPGTTPLILLETEEVLIVLYFLDDKDETIFNQDGGLGVREKRELRQNTRLY